VGRTMDEPSVSARASMTSPVSGSIQPDRKAFALVMLQYYRSLSDVANATVLMASKGERLASRPASSCARENGRAEAIVRRAGLI
jgi:hypothetical protein